MGKTRRNTCIEPRSYSSTHRGFRKILDRSSHHSHRTRNRGNKYPDEVSYIEFKYTKYKKERYNYNCFIKASNVPNMDRYELWEVCKGNNSLEVNIINKIIEAEAESDIIYLDYDTEHLKASLKQIQRRGNIGSFMGHRNGNN